MLKGCRLVYRISGPEQTTAIAAWFVPHVGFCGERPSKEFPSSSSYFQGIMTKDIFSKVTMNQSSNANMYIDGADLCSSPNHGEVAVATSNRTSMCSSFCTSIWFPSPTLNAWKTTYTDLNNIKRRFGWDAAEIAAQLHPGKWSSSDWDKQHCCDFIASISAQQMMLHTISAPPTLFTPSFY